MTRPLPIPAMRLLALLGVVAALLGGPSRPAVAGAAGEDDLYAGVLPELREKVAARAGALDEYRIVATFDPQAGTIRGTATITYVNRTGEPLEAVYFRLVPNAPFYQDASLQIEEARVGGRTWTDPTDWLSVQDTVLAVPLERPLPTGDRVEIALAFQTELVSRYGAGLAHLLGLTPSGGTWLLADWHPLVAPWLPESGWYLDRLSLTDGPAVTEPALYDVALTVPSGLRVVATGDEVERRGLDDQIRHRFVSGPVRGFVAAIDADFIAVETQSGATGVTAWADGADAEATDLADRAAAEAAEAMTAYGRRFGAYPFTDYDVVVLPSLGAAGFAVPGIAFVGVPYPDALSLDALAAGDAGDTRSQPDLAIFDHIVAHEVGHQWWGMVVGSDYRQHTFLVEGLTNMVALEYRAWTDGEAAADRLLIATVAQPYLITLETLGDQTADRTDRTGLGLAQVGIVYGKATLGFLAIRVAIGEDAFYDALDAYAEEHGFAVAAPEDLLSAFEAAAGQDLRTLWHHWFEDAETTADEIRELIRAA